ncbi:MAG: hypothetical protein HYU98_04790, partial [Deltaproteobacteria bacterium]|nr:hypothetical protein [Deltaproteobacteria bacterium]
WHSGIVDTKSFTIDEWRAAFDAHSRGDGTFSLSKEEFLSKEPYRYKGEIMVPFDAMQINEGKYTDEGLNELFASSIAPSCLLSPSELETFLDAFKGDYRDAAGLIKINAKAKKKIQTLLEESPSPLRRLELIFDYLLSNPREAEAELSEELKQAAAEGTAVSPEQLAKLQASAFSMQPLNESEEKWQTLNVIEKRKPKKESASKDGSTTTLKKVKRSRKGLRG